MHNSLLPLIKVAIFFGGPSREREISFAGGRTVYDHLDRKKFEPLPIFVDSLGNFILLRKQYLYQGTIREFYPSAIIANFWGIPLYIESLPTTESHALYIAKIGKKIDPTDFSKYFDIAFLCLHGPYGEDGTIQGLLRWYQIPYTGSDILPAALAMNKIFQQKLLQQSGFVLPRSVILAQKEWLGTDDKKKLFDQIMASLGLPFVVKSSRQGSSIGVTIVEHSILDSFIHAVHKAFFMETISYDQWQNYTRKERKNWLTNLIDVREGIGFPLQIADQTFYTPHTLLDYIELYFQKKQPPILLMSTQAEASIIIEAFIQGREFSCMVLEAEKGNPIALPPTEMVKGKLHFDYRAKYLPGIVRKQTPMVLSTSLLKRIRKQAVYLFQLLDCQVYARIDGFITDDNEIILNDPNTTAGMHPASFLFHQAAEIGLHPTQLLTFIIERSIEVRKDQGYLIADTLLQRVETRK
ncbi:D-alanine--D-alanine ligase family protein [Candidatus Cardinium hertigii]|uniref:D-alanine--D-alanine ligase family protein n=1 Tax=Candidatus Cardinium hertigii TaxID=247481 RepID=UPI003D7C3E74